MTIDLNTGMIHGTPNSEKATGGEIIVTAVDTLGNSASISILYLGILKTFAFLGGNFDINTPGSSPMIWGSIITPREIGTDVVGGLPWPTGAKYHMSADGLLPNFDINLNGRITGTAQVSKGVTTAEIYAIDYRGRKISRLIMVDAINNNI
jgi:hypothetical protein